MRSNPPIRGHYLLHEGRTISERRDWWDGNPTIIGHLGGCQCGAKPDGFPDTSPAAMQRWHREHKTQIRARDQS